MGTLQRKSILQIRRMLRDFYNQKGEADHIDSGVG